MGVNPKAAGAVAGIFAAAAFAVPVVTKWEGYEAIGYRDPVGLPTSCWGHTGPDAVVGKAYSEAECQRQLASDLVKHGLDIDRCLPAEVPARTRAAFISFAFNVGAAKFCGSSVSRKALAGDLPGACNELSKWVYGGGKPLPGLIRRRADERALCLSGLTEGA